MRDIVIVGGGFAGLSAALNAADQAGDDPHIRVVLISDIPHLVIRPRLYEKDPEKLAVPLQPLLDLVGIDFVQGRVVDIDTEKSELVIKTRIDAVSMQSYDQLVLTVGSELRELKIPGLAETGFDIDNYASAVKFDAHLKKISKASPSDTRNGFVIIGAGMTGIELACELRDRLAQHGGAEVADAARIMLVERANQVGPDFGDDPRPIIEDALQAAGVELRLGQQVTEVGSGHVMLGSGEKIPAQTVIVATGMRAGGLTTLIPARRDDAGRLYVDENLKVEGLDNVFAAGDAAHAIADGEHPAMMSCQHARTMGKYAGFNAAHDLLGLDQRGYIQSGYTTCLDLGASGAVFSTGWAREVKSSGQEAKARKRWINTELIYPPEPTSREAILELMRIDENGR